MKRKPQPKDVTYCPFRCVWQKHNECERRGGPLWEKNDIGAKTGRCLAQTIK